MPRYIELIADDEVIEYHPPGLDGTIYCRRLTIDTRNDIQLRYQKTSHRGGRHVFVPEEKTPDVEKDLWDYMVVRWDGVMMRPGSAESAPCTRETKYRLPETIRIGILALADEGNISNLRNGESPGGSPVDPTRR